MKYKKGDRVLVCDGLNTGLLGTVGGYKGTSVAICGDDERMRGHDCDGLCSDGGFLVAIVLAGGLGFILGTKIKHVEMRIWGEGHGGYGITISPSLYKAMQRCHDGDGIVDVSHRRYESSLICYTGLEYTLIDGEWLFRREEAL